MLALWCELTGLDPDLHGDLCELARVTNGSIPEWFKPWIAAEREARSLRIWHPILIPGLFHTEAYARAILTVDGGDSDAMVTSRLERSKILDRTEPPDVVAVIDEFALRRMIGSADVMAEQLAHLADMSRCPNIVVQVPAGIGAYGGEGGAFDIASADGVNDLLTGSEQRHYHAETRASSWHRRRRLLPARPPAVLRRHVPPETPRAEPRRQRQLPRPGQYPVPRRQLVLFDAERGLAAGHRIGFPAPPLPDLPAALDDTLAGHAARHGWSRQLQAVTRSALRVLLATQDTPGAPIPATDVEALTQLAFTNVRAVTEILTAAGMLHDNRETALDAWFTCRGSGLPEPMAAEFRSWFEALHDGSRTPPRLRPRSTATIRVHVARTAPILHAWAREGHQSLREITRQDILGALPAQANQHRQALTALRSLLRFLKGRRVIFADPAARLRHDRLQNGQPLRARRAGRLPRPAQRPARQPQAHRRP